MTALANEMWVEVVYITPTLKLLEGCVIDYILFPFWGGQRRTSAVGISRGFLRGYNKQSPPLSHFPTSYDEYVVKMEGEKSPVAVRLWNLGTVCNCPESI